MISKLLFVAVLATLAVFSSAQYTSSGNCVVDVWRFNQETGVELSKFGPLFIPGSRENALTGLSIHDALNSIDPQYEFFFGDAAAIAGISRGRTKHASLCAAVLSAFNTIYANHTVERLKPNSIDKYLSPALIQSTLTKLSAFYNWHMNNLRADHRENIANRIDDGVAIGVASAQQVLETRWNDGHRARYPNFNPAPAVGQFYNRAGEFYIYPHWKDIQPLVLSAANEFIPVSPFINQPLDSEIYLNALAETKALGKNDSTLRTEAQTHSARWWNAGYLGHTVLVIHELSLTLGYSLHKSAVTYAAASTAQCDGMINNLWNKNHFNYFRPWMAINNDRHLDYSAYPGIQALQDPNWVPFLPTPGNQEYPAGHPQLTTCSTNTIQRLLGFDDFPQGSVNVNYREADGTYRNQDQVFASFSDMREQVYWARIYGGMHLGPSNRAGMSLGFQIAEKVAAKFKRIE